MGLTQASELRDGAELGQIFCFCSCSCLFASLFICSGVFSQSSQASTKPPNSDGGERRAAFRRLVRKQQDRAAAPGCGWRDGWRKEGRKGRVEGWMDVVPFSYLFRSLT